MRIQVLASSSKGNCYAVWDGGSSLLIECGIPIAQIRQKLNFGLSAVAGVLVSHSHLDHSRSVKELMRAGCDVYASTETFEALGVTGHHRAHPIEATRQVQIGPWTVLPFEAKHDVPCLGFLVACGGAKLMFLTDSSYCPHRFNYLSHVMVEANHSIAILRQNVADGVVDSERYRRTRQNHMALETLLDFFKANDLSALQETYLLHLSRENSDEAAFKAAVQRATGRPVYICQE